MANTITFKSGPFCAIKKDLTIELRKGSNGSHLTADIAPGAVFVASSQGGFSTIPCVIELAFDTYNESLIEGSRGMLVEKESSVSARLHHAEWHATRIEIELDSDIDSD